MAKSLKPRPIVQALLLGWAAAFIGSFVAFAVTAPTDFGLTRGVNRIEVFVMWQALAGALAVFAAMISRRLQPGWLRRLALAPAGVLLAGVAGILGLIIWANLSRPPPISPQLPATTAAPAQPAPTAD